MAFSPDGRRLASAGFDGTIRIWDVETGRESRVITLSKQSIRGLAWSADGRVVASGGDDRTVRLFDSESGEELRALTGHFRAVSRVQFSSDGRRLVSADNQGGLKVWSWLDGTLLSEMKAPPVGQHRTVLAISHDLRRVLVSERQSGVMLFDTSNGALLGSTATDSSNVTPGASAAAFSADERTALATVSPNELLVWNPARKTEKRFPLGFANSFRFLSSILVHPNGKWALVGDPTRLDVVDLATGQVLRAVISPQGGGYRVMSLSADGTLIGATTQHLTIELREVQTGKVVRRMGTPRYPEPIEF